jgi:hypothetical protein
MTRQYSADERGLHQSDDGGRSWRTVSPHAKTPNHLRGLAALGVP